MRMYLETMSSEADKTNDGVHVYY